MNVPADGGRAGTESPKAITTAQAFDHSMSADIAAERIERLAALAEAAVAEGEFDRSREYVRLARRLAERHRLSLPRSFARAACDRCNVYQRPGVNVRVRTGRGRVVRRCDCGATARYPYSD